MQRQLTKNILLIFTKLNQNLIIKGISIKKNVYICIRNRRELSMNAKKAFV